MTYNEAGRGADLESRLFTKSGPAFRTRLVATAGGLGKIESSFYAFVRPELEIEAPPTRSRLYARRDEIFAAMMRSLEVNLQGPQTAPAL